jgi:hypothetical protein
VMPAKKVVVVLGMHRSGTSLVGNIVQLMGVDLGANLIAPDPNNQAGYFEHAGIVQLHEELLEVIDRRWTGPKGTLDYPDSWWLWPKVQLIVERLKEVTKLETAERKGIWGFKDPRTSRLIPLWNRIFDDLGFEPYYILAVRDPIAVAQSIQKRDGLKPSHSQLLWLVHNMDAIIDAGPRLICISDYDAWLTAPMQQMDYLADSIGITLIDETIRNHMLNVIRPDLCHSESITYPFLPFVEELSDALERSARSGYLHEEVWEIFREINRSKDLFRPWADIIATEVTVRKRELPTRAVADRNRFWLITRLEESLRDRFDL